MRKRGRGEKKKYMCGPRELGDTSIGAAGITRCLRAKREDRVQPETEKKEGVT